MAESREFRRARKEAIVAANLAGAEATLRKGREMDEEHNRKPQPEPFRPEEFTVEMHGKGVIVDTPEEFIAESFMEEKEIEPVQVKQEEKKTAVTEEKEIVQTTDLELLTKKQLLAMIRKLSEE